MKARRRRRSRGLALTLAALSLVCPVLAWATSALVWLAGYAGAGPVYWVSGCFELTLIISSLVLGYLAMWLGRKEGGIAVMLPAIAGILLSVGTLLLVGIMLAMYVHEH